MPTWNASITNSRSWQSVPATRLSVDELSAFEQLHYHGTAALDIALDDFTALAIMISSRVNWVGYASVPNG